MFRKRQSLSIEQILRWADEHHTQTGRWPRAASGPILSSPDDTWLAVNLALGDGHRGLPGNDSLAKLLMRERGVRNHKSLPHLTEAKILAWAKAHCKATGACPKVASGPIRGAPGELWRNVDQALRRGARGLPGDDSLTNLLARKAGGRPRVWRPPLTIEQVLAWADGYHEQTGRWPSALSGPEALPAGEMWKNIDSCLRYGSRGLPGNSSLSTLLRERRGAHRGRDRAG